MAISGVPNLVRDRADKVALLDGRRLLLLQRPGKDIGLVRQALARLEELDRIQTKNRQ
jgi:hypothetical protein